MKKRVWVLLTAMLAGFEASQAGLIESYVARIGPNDHYSSRGVRLRSVAEILRQDRANLHRFGLGDPEDQYDSYFRSASRRSRIARYYRHGIIEPGLASEILYGNPLIRVEVYPGSLVVSRAQPSYNPAPPPVHTTTLPPAAPPPVAAPPVTTAPVPPTPVLLKSLQDLQTDILGRLRRHGGLASFGYEELARRYGPIPMKHELVGLYRLPPTGLPRVLAVAASSPARHNDYHAAHVQLSFFEYLRDLQGNWHLQESHIATEKYGGWGAAPDRKEIKVLELGPGGLYGIAMEGTGTGQGWLIRSMWLLMPASTIFIDALKLELGSDNGGTGQPPVTDWKADYRLENTGSSFYDIVVHRHGVKEGKKIDETLRYRFDPIEHKYLPVRGGSGSAPTATHPPLPAKEKGADFHTGTGDLVATLRLPVMLQSFRKLFGEPHRAIYPAPDEDSPMGQIYVWNFDGARLEVMVDNYDSTGPRYDAKTLGVWLISDGKKYVPSLCGTELGKDTIVEAYRKVLACLPSTATGKLPVSAMQYPWFEEPVILKFKDPRTGLFNVLYFKYGYLWKIWQGSVDPTEAG
jgi:hypothetical protein